MFFDNKFRNIFILCVILIFILSFSSVYSNNLSNVTSFDTNDEFLTVDNYSDLYQESNDNLLGKTYSLNGGKFSDIQNMIDKAESGDTIRLSGKFKADNENSIIKINKNK